MQILVTGGAGYIGGVISRILLREGHQVRILDDLSTGHAATIPPGSTLIEGSILDSRAVDEGLAGVDAVIHCAGKSLVSESVQKPELYMQVNLDGSRNLLDRMEKAGVDRIVFSSSAAVYEGNGRDPLTEASPELPANPYGASKLEVDRLLSQSHFRGASFRYFNVAGALHTNGTWFGERHNPETHLIPNVLKATQENPLRVFGNDWPTSDGTCVRDYIHVVDLAKAHIAALEHGEFAICNLGSGDGSSVLTVIETAQEVLGRDIPHAFAQRRDGDPAVLVASYQKAQNLFGWRPERSLREMISDAAAFVGSLN